MNLCGTCEEVDEEDRSEISFMEEAVEYKESPLKVDDCKSENIHNLIDDLLEPKATILKDKFNKTFEEYIAKVPEVERKNCLMFFQKWRESMKAEVMHFISNKQIKGAEFLQYQAGSITYQNKNCWYRGQIVGHAPCGIGYMCEEQEDKTLRLSAGKFAENRRLPENISFSLWSNGSWFFGELNKGMIKTGIHFVNLDNGNYRKYEGMFVGGQLLGRGKITYYGQEGYDSYEGNIINNKPNGKGKILWGKGANSLEVTFQNGKASGSGTLYEKSNDHKTCLTYWKDGVNADDPHMIVILPD